MSTTNILSATKRDATGKGVARKLRQGGRIPAVLYGRDMDTILLTVDEHEADRLFRSISVENTIVDLAVEGENEAFPTLVREIQSHPVKANLVHIDFLRVQAGVKVDVEIPVHLNGVPVGVKLNGGVLEQVIHELPVRCIPSLIPESFEVDVSALDLTESLHVSDLVLPEGVEVTISMERTVCAVAVPRVIEEEDEEDEDELLEGELPEGEEGPEGAAEAGDEDSDGDEG